MPPAVWRPHGMKTSDKIRALPWKGNARDDLIAPDPLAALSGGSKSTYGIAREMIEGKQPFDLAQHEWVDASVHAANRPAQVRADE